MIRALILATLTLPAHAAEHGLATWYRPTGHRTASGTPYTGRALTCAHPWRRLGSRVLVTHGGRQAVLLVDDRMPRHPGRVVDLSPAAARVLGVTGMAVVEVGEAAEMPNGL